MDLATLEELSIGKTLGPTQVERGVDISKAFARALINEGYHKIEREALWKFSEAVATISLTAGTATASPPTDLAVPLMARNETTGQELTFHDERQRFEPTPRPASNRRGSVQFYGVYGGELRFYPTPQAATTVTLRYYKTWPDLAAPTDEPLIPVTFHDILSDYAAWKLTLRVPPVGGRYLPASAAEPHLEAWQNGLARMLASPHVLTSFDKVENEDLIESMMFSEDW